MQEGNTECAEKQWGFRPGRLRDMRKGRLRDGEVYIKGKESQRNTDGQAEEVEEEVADIELLSEIVLFFLRFLSDWNEGSFVTANNKA